MNRHKQFILEQTISNPKFDEPITSKAEVYASSVCAVVKKILLSGPCACELKRTGKTEWMDDLGSRFTLTLSVKE